MPLVECVPNFSDGRDPALLEELVEAIDAVSDAWVLDGTDYRTSGRRKAVVDPA